MKDLLGTTVIDRLSGQPAEIVGQDSGRPDCYLLEFIDTTDAEGGQTAPFESGHRAWRFPSEIV